MGDDELDVGEDLLGEGVGGIVGASGAEVGEALGAEQEAETGGAGAGEEAGDLLGGEGGELVDDEQSSQAGALAARR